MGVHFIRLTDIQAAYLYDVLVDWEGSFEYPGELREELGNMEVGALNTKLKYAFNSPSEVTLAYYPPEPTDYDESQDPSRSSFDGQSELEYLDDGKDDITLGDKLMDKVIEVNGWFNV